ncbi:MAG: metalloregulator ArsR/SmtB family transcription factor [bacterium]|nr:metalloregulator ArsR/SmtB family transcription factor [bacterium]
MATETSELVFRALGDSTRQRIMQLVVKQELNVSDLVSVLAFPQSTVSRHLRILREAGLIRDRREGTAVAYRAVLDCNGEGDDAGLHSRVLGWVAEQALPEAMARRLDSVLHQRRLQADRFFTRVGHKWDQMRTEYFGAEFPLEALTALLPEHWTVADVGAGTGYLLPLLTARFDHVIAVDPVPDMLEIARSHPALGRADNVEYRTGDLSKLPISDGQVDLALAILVLHHVPSPPEALAELRRIVKPGGRLLVVEQAAHQCAEFHERMQDRWWGFEPGELSGEIERAGFSDIWHGPLRTAAPANGQVGAAPELFVLTARRTEDETGWRNW